MSRLKLYRHFLITNYSNIKTKIDDFRKAKNKKNKTRRDSR